MKTRYIKRVLQNTLILLRLLKNWEKAQTIRIKSVNERKLLNDSEFGVSFKK
jgi:hypothetical protein